MKQSASLALMATLLSTPLSAFAVSNTIPNDISGHWAQTTIENWTTKGFINGYDDGSFEPDSKITRAEFVTIVNRAMGFEQANPISFRDVTPDMWYHQAVAAAVTKGYCKGYEDDTFRAEAPIDRAEAATIIARIVGLQLDESGAEGFSDAIPTWAKGYIGAVVKAGYMNGFSSTEFGASTPITRAETVVALNNVLEKGINTDITTENNFPENAKDSKDPNNIFQLSRDNFSVCVGDDLDQIKIDITAIPNFDLNTLSIWCSDFKKARQTTDETTGITAKLEGNQVILSGKNVKEGSVTFFVNVDGYYVNDEDQELTPGITVHVYNEPVEVNYEYMKEGHTARDGVKAKSKFTIEWNKQTDHDAIPLEYQYTDLRLSGCDAEGIKVYTADLKTEKELADAVKAALRADKDVMSLYDIEDGEQDNQFILTAKEMIDGYVIYLMDNGAIVATNREELQVGKDNKAIPSKASLYLNGGIGSKDAGTWVLKLGGKKTFEVELAQGDSSSIMIEKLRNAMKNDKQLNITEISGSILELEEKNAHEFGKILPNDASLVTFNKK